MTAIQNFNFHMNEIRVITDQNGNPWFVAKDVCDALSLVNTTRSLDRIDQDEKGIHTVNTLGGEQNLLVITEAGMYALVLTSNKPEAKVFSKWLRTDVIPSIRKTGSYSVAAPKTRLELARENLSLVEEIEAKEAQLMLADKTIQEQAPKVQYYEEVLQSESTFKPSILADELGLTSAIEFNKFFYKHGVHRKIDGVWVLYAKYENNGYTKNETFPYKDSNGVHKTKITTVWTEKGRIFLHDFVKKLRQKVA